MKFWIYNIFDILYTHLWHRRIWAIKLRERHYKRQLVRLLVAASIFTFCLALMPGCAQQLTPQQVQTVAAVTAATVAIAGTTAQAFPNKHLSPQQVQAITAAAVQTAQVVGQAAATWTATPSPTPATPPHP